MERDNTLMLFDVLHYGGHKLSYRPHLDLRENEMLSWTCLCAGTLNSNGKEVGTIVFFVLKNEPVRIRPVLIKSCFSLSDFL